MGWALYRSEYATCCLTTFDPARTVKYWFEVAPPGRRDGVVVQITEIDESKLGPFPRTDDPEAMEGDPFVLLTTKTTNSTKSTLQYVPTAVLEYGPEKTAAAAVWVDELDAAQDVEPNEAFDYTLGFIIPKEFYDQVVMEMTVTLDPLRTVVFSGSISPS